MNKVIGYSVLQIKQLDESSRTITGIATTPKPDRVGDIIEPLGAKFKNPLPLLWQHRHDSPVGQVRFSRPTEEGIKFTATLPSDAELEGSGELFERVREAWKSVALGLVRGVSIGFRPIEYSFIEDSGGIRFTETEIYELSLVTIPANAEATIEQIKSIDRRDRAASGKEVPSAVATKGGASPVVKKSIHRRDQKMDYESQIKDFLATRAGKVKELDGIMSGSVEAGETLDAEQSEKYDTLQAEIKSIDAHVKRLREMVEVQKSSAQPVDHEARESANAPATDSYTPRGISAVKRLEKLDKGIRFARVVRCLGLSKGSRSDAVEYAKELYPQDDVIQTIVKAAVPAGSTVTGNWGAGLVGEGSDVYADFVEFLRPQTILGRFGTDGIPALRSVPFRVDLVGQTSGGSGYWVGEGKAKPLTNFGFERKRLEPLKVANIAVITEELLRDSSPSADALIRQSLADALREELDVTFIDPSVSASAGVSPASITNGVTPIPSTGTDAASIRRDVSLAMGTFIAANNPPTSGVWIMSATSALALSLMNNPLGQPEFPGLTMAGGSFIGMPVIVSEYVPADSSGHYVALVNAGDIYLGDDGGLRVDVSREASLEMSDTPTQDSAKSTPVATSMVSMWQTNSVAFRAERTINWAKRRASAVALLSGVNWGADASSGGS